MRILLSCLQSGRQRDVPAHGFWELYFKRGIEEAGAEWVEVPGVDWVEPLAHDERDLDSIARWREQSWQRVIEFVRREHAARPLDVFLGYLYPRHIEASAIKELQTLGIPCVNFFCDNVREFRRVPDEYRCFDAHWVPEQGAVRMYEEAGLCVVHAPMPVWVPPARRSTAHVELYPPTFIGSRDVLREAFFAEAIRLGADVRLRGPGWRREITRQPQKGTSAAPKRPASLLARLNNQRADVQRFGIAGLVWKATYRAHRPIADSMFAEFVEEPVFGEAYVDVTQQASITIGVNRYPSYHRSFANPGTYSRLRDVEAPMLGACYITEWAEGLQDMYEPTNEVETYTTASELVEKIRMLSADPTRRARMRRQAQKRALNDHSVPKSLERIADAIGVRITS